MSYLRTHLDDALLLSGSACIVAGVALWSIPAALVTAGVLLIGFGLLIGKKMAQDAEKSIQ